MKAFDKVRRPLLWEILIKKGIPYHLIQVIKSLYAGTRICIDTGFKIGKTFLNINLGVRQGCSLSATLFNLYIDEMLNEWNCYASCGIEIAENCFLNSILYADDQVLIAETEDELQLNIYKLSKIARYYNCEISTSKTHIMAFCGKDPVRSKIVVENQVLNQVSNFNYLGNDISYNYDRDVEKKLSRFQLMCGTIRRTLGKKTRKETQLKFYKTMAIPTLLYGSECWVLKQREMSRIQASEMKFLRAVKGCTKADHERNQDIRKELRVVSVLDQIQNYKRNWTQHLYRMDKQRLPQKAWKYRPLGKRDPGRPRKRWTIEPEQAVGPRP